MYATSAPAPFKKIAQTHHAVVCSNLAHTVFQSIECVRCSPVVLTFSTQHVRSYTFPFFLYTGTQSRSASIVSVSYHANRFGSIERQMECAICLHGKYPSFTVTKYTTCVVIANQSLNVAWTEHCEWSKLNSIPTVTAYCTNCGKISWLRKKSEPLDAQQDLIESLVQRRNQIIYKQALVDKEDSSALTSQLDAD